MIAERRLHHDRCHAGDGLEQQREGPFPVGSQVVHDSFGDGQVVRYEEGKVVVLFDEIGYQTLALDIVRERGILQPTNGIEAAERG